MAVITKRRQLDRIGPVNLAKAAAGGAQGAAKAAGGNRRIRRAGVRPCWPPGLALLCLAAAGHSVAQVEYRCFPESAPAAKPKGPASVSLAYRGYDGIFGKWRDGHVPVTIDHRGTEEDYPKDKFEELLLSVLREVEGLADLTFEYRPTPADTDGELDDDALDEAFATFVGIVVDWSSKGNAGVAVVRRFGTRTATSKTVPSTDEWLAELGYVPFEFAELAISPSYSTARDIESRPLRLRRVLMHELLHGLGLGHSDNPLSPYACGSLPI